VHAPADAILLRVFVGENDRHGRQPLYQAIVDRALASGMAVATVLHGLQGFGQSRRMHTELNVDAQPRLPIVIEIVDSEEKIEAFLPVLEEIVESGLVTLEKVRVLQYGRRRGSLLARFWDKV
jgi:PII-like signaling protein